eukprot:maker-scaffold213_size254208-snap-gene-1.29 protein:Tk11732 transcript:maker-scaffold213_size254208-snap-gene-1.29-mRNA-1 annotation:"multispecies: aspartate-semialdehyde dehydrogenase"
MNFDAVLDATKCLEDLDAEKATKDPETYSNHYRLVVKAPPALQEDVDIRRFDDWRASFLVYIKVVGVLERPRSLLLRGCRQRQFGHLAQRCRGAVQAAKAQYFAVKNAEYATHGLYTGDYAAAPVAYALRAHPNGAVTSVDEPAVQVAKAQHFAAKNAAHGLYTVDYAGAYAAAPVAYALRADPNGAAVAKAQHFAAKNAAHGLYTVDYAGGYAGAYAAAPVAYPKSMLLAHPKGAVTPIVEPVVQAARNSEYPGKGYLATRRIRYASPIAGALQTYAAAPAHYGPALPSTPMEPSFPSRHFGASLIVLLPPSIPVTESISIMQPQDGILWDIAVKEASMAGDFQDPLDLIHLAGIGWRLGFGSGGVPVIHGQPEWEGVHNFTKQAYPNSGAWLQVSSMVECTNGQDECLHAQALEGQGLGVVWPPDSFLSSYSRLIGGNSRYRCLVVSESPPYVWKRVSCTDRYHALCIQRQCQWKPPP